MKYHLISEINRAIMLDWLIQVFRAFTVESPEIYYTTLTVLDRYYVGKKQ